MFRFLMSVGKTKEAKAVLESYSKLWGYDKLDLNDIILSTSEKSTNKKTSIKEMVGISKLS